MTSLSKWLVAALLATSTTATPFTPDTNAPPPRRAPAIPAGLNIDSPLDPAFKRADKPTPPPIGFPGLPPRPTKTTTIRPDSPDGASDIIVGDSSRRTCTHTVTPEKLKDWPCPTGGTLSVYRSWVMSTRTVDCKGCGEVYIPASTYHCPIDEIKTTEWVPTATTYTTFVCAPTKPAELDAATAQEKRQLDKRQGITFSGPGGVVEMGCPTTYVIQPQQTAGVIWTEYKAWSTKTVGLQCSGCPLVTSTAKIGLGPAGRFKTTTTMPLGTTTAYKCQ